MPVVDLMHVVLRDYQELLIYLLREALRLGKCRPLVVAATGSGKTVVFSFVAKSAAAKGKKVLILAHRDQLIKQASNKLRDNEVPHGIIMAGFTQNLRMMVQVASVQTLVRRYENLRWTPDIIIIDEAHLSAAKSYLAIINHWPKAVVIGFTGSPCRLDGKPLGAESGGIYDDLIQAISIRELIERGYLVQPEVYAPAQQLDLSGIKKAMGDYDQQALAEVVDKPKLVGEAVSHYKSICNGVPAVAWCVTVQHARHVADQFNDAGIKAVMLCGEHDTAYRDKVMAQLALGEVQVVTFVGILVEGVDCPAIGAILLLRPTLSLSSYLQVIGRGLRPYEGWYKKDVCFVLDHAGLSFKHGFADEDREWELNAEPRSKGKRKKQDDEPRVDVMQCKGCYLCFTKQDAAAAGEQRGTGPCCPKCGHPVEVRERKIEHEDGTLTKITREMAEAMRKNKRQEVGKAKTLEELQKIAAERGYKPSWARIMWEQRNRKKAPGRPMPNAEPTLDELKQMSLPDLENVAAEQGWPSAWASTFFHQHRGSAAA